MDKLKLIIVDDNEPFRRAFRKLVTQEFNAEIIGEVSCAAEFEALENYQRVDIVFMDLMMPGTDGFKLAQQILWRCPNIKIVAITMHFDKVYLNLLISMGFKGCIYKGNLFNEISNTIKIVMNGEYCFPKDIVIKR